MNKEEIGLEDTQRFLPNDTDPSSVRFSDEKKISFNGLSKEEIMKYGNDPQWVRIRWFLFILFWVVWVSMLVSAVLIVINSEKCAYVPKLNFWQKEVFYQVDVESFKDSNGDTVGDLVGLQNQLPYFENLQIKTLCLRDNLIDETDPKKIKSKFGDESTIKNLKKQLEAKDMHLIVDLPISSLAKDADKTLTYWLTNFADGVRITGLDKTPTKDQFNQFRDWISLTEKIYEKTFKPKFISFYPLTVSNELKPSLNIDQSLLNINLKDLEDHSKFLSKVNQTKNGATSFILNDYQSTRIRDSLKNNEILPVYHAIVLLLKGTPIILYGDELAFSKGEKLMKWDNSAACGFSSNSSLKLNCDMSVKESFAHGTGKSLPVIYRELIKLRQEPSFVWGDLRFNSNSSENVISFVREASGFDGFLVAANTDKDKAFLLDFKEMYGLPDKANVAYFYSSDGDNKDFQTGAEISTDNIKLKRAEFLVLRFSRKPKPVEEKKTSIGH